MQKNGAPTLRLWTFQSEQTALALESGQPFVSRPDFEAHWSERPGDRWGFRHSYEWMASQMARRIGAPPPGCSLPVWAWARAPACSKSGAPDLRSMKDCESTALIELRVDPSEALISDHGLWHMVLNGSPLALSQADGEAADRRIAELRVAAGRPANLGSLLDEEDFADPAVMRELSRSWERIFEVAPIVPGQPAKMAFKAAHDPEWAGSDDIAAQACLWRIEPRHLASWRRIEPKAIPAARGPR